MICSSCGSDNPLGKRFCGDCGATLDRRCPTCGAGIEAGKRFCGDCGAPLGADLMAEAAAASLPGVGSTERKLVSVLFADIVGFTAIAERLDPEDARQLLARYFDVVGEVIRAHGGTVEKFIGDAVMAVWGAPLAHEDDAERAVRAALEVVAAVPAVAETLRARAGVLTGEAAVSVGAAGQGMVAGDIVNTASRLQALADPGTVLVGEATARAAGRAIAFEDAGRHEVKGRQDPVRAFRAVRVLGRSSGIPGLEPPFVGRDAELRLLKDLLAATTRDRRSHVVSVVGPTGIGKSRLSKELGRYVEGLAGPVWWHEGRCLGYGEGVTFWALGEMVRGRCGLLESDDEATTRVKVVAAVEQAVPDLAERAWIEEALLALLGTGGPAPNSERLFAAWRTFFERLAGSGPVVLVFEDFHFADPGLVEFTEQLLDWARSMPVLVLTLSRPEGRAREESVGDRRRRHGYTELHLEPLAPAAMRELLDGLVLALPDPAARSIVARAEGIPLYAVETVRMLVDQGRLVADGAHCSVVGDLGEIAVPETLVELVAARLDALDPRERSLLQDASVLGHTFTVPALAAVSALEPAAVQGRLRALARRDLLAVVDDPASPERGQHAFVQALIREVAYSTISKRDRVRLHLAAAAFFESLGSDELAAAVAGQHLAAWRSASGAEADALADRTRSALRAAAERATRMGAHSQALDLLTEALGLPAGDAERGAMLEAAGKCASGALHHQRAEELLREAVVIHRSVGDLSGAARATAELASAMIQHYQYIPALALLESEGPSYTDLDGDPGVAALRGQLARVLFLVDQPRRSIEVAEGVLETAEIHRWLPLLVDTLVTKGSALAELGRRVEATALLQAGIALAVENDLHRAAFRGRQNLGTFIDDDDPRAALELFRENVAEAARLGIADPVLPSIVALMEIGTGEWEAAEASMQELLELDLEAADRSNPVWILLMMAACRGEPTDDLLAEFDRLAGRSEEASDIAGMALALGYVALGAGRLEDAHEEFVRAAVTYSGFATTLRFAATASLWRRDAGSVRADLRQVEPSRANGRVFELTAATLEAGLAAIEGRSDAVRAFQRARDGWLGCDLRWDAALVAIAMATLLDPRDPVVLEAAAEARELLVRLRATPFVARLDEALDRSSSRTVREPTAAMP